MTDLATTDTSGFMGATVRLVQGASGRYGGHCVFPFSQALPPVSTMLKMHNQTEGGVCLALSTKWMVEHAHDRSLWNWLYTGKKLNSDALYNVMINFVDDEVQGMDWLWCADKYLNSHGLHQRTKITDGTSMVRSSKTKTANRNRGGQMGRRLMEAMMRGHKNTSGNYVLLFMRGNGAHAMCAWIGADVAFFDPNVGEFWFDSRQKFYRWLPMMTQLMNYDGVFWEAEARPYSTKR